MAAPFEEDSLIFLFPNFVKFYLFMFAYPENFMSLAQKVKKFKFWRPCLKGTPHSDTPKFCQILYFPYIYLP